MSSVHHIVVPTDFSPDGEGALRYAKAFARVTGSTLHLIHVLRPMEQRVVYGVPAITQELETIQSQAREYARKSLKEMAAEAQGEGLNAQWRLLSGNVTDEIHQVASELGETLIVVATHGHSGFDALVFGSTCEKIIRTAVAPVLVVKHPEHEFVKPSGDEILLKQILVPFDFSELSKAALPLATALAHRFNARMTLVHVVEPHENAEVLPELAMSHVDRVEKAATQALQRLADDIDGLDVNVMVRTGSASREIVRGIEELDADLVVMATHGRTGLSHVFYGSVSEKMIRTAPCPVLTIRPGASGGADEGARANAEDAAHYFG